MKIHFLGTCAGTEPMAGRKHVSFVVEYKDGIYWFDAGECCSRTAHLVGIDLMTVKSIFISHTHLDHIGGLANLLWTIRKLSKIGDERMQGKDIDLFIPNLTVWDSIRTLLANTENKFRCDFTVRATQTMDGKLFDKDGFSVRALHNNHMPKEDGYWRSFSYRIEAENKIVVYSGDVAGMDDIDPFIRKCDLLLMETGHHKVEDVCEYIKNKNMDINLLGFIHSGRAIIKDPEHELQKAEDILGKRVFIAEDGTYFQI